MSKLMWIAVIGGIIFFIMFSSLFINWYITKDWGRETIIVTGWNDIQLGFNIFTEDGQGALFLHGDDWMLKDFLQKQTYPKKMTFVYHKQTVFVGECSGYETWNHVTEIYDEWGTKIFERELWQER